MVYDEQMHELGEESTRLQTRAIPPSPYLQQFVHRYFVLTHEANLPSDSRWYILPDNATHLIFYLYDPGNTITPKWVLIGPRSKHKIINRVHRRFTFICSFRPGALGSFVNIPLCELRDQAIDALSLLQNVPSGIFEKLAFRALGFDTSGFVRELEQFLWNSVTTPSTVHQVAQKFYLSHLDRDVQPRLAKVSKDLGYSDRQLRNLIQNYIGHSPKMVGQIERFTRSLSLVQNRKERNWANIAYSAGYYDQSHMISDYHKLVGVTPGTLFS